MPDTGETLVDSVAIIDHLDEVHGRDRALTPASGAGRRAVQKVAALMMGACDKGLHAAYERNHHPPERVHQPWSRFTQADITAFIAERLARGLGVDTEIEMPRLHAHCRRLLDEEPFRSTEP